MTAVQTQYRPASAHREQRTVVEAADAAGPQVCDDMSVEVALAVMAAARTGRLAVCDQDGRRTGLVTLTELDAVRDSSAYTDRVRLRDILGDRGAITSPAAHAAGSRYAVRTLRPGALPPVDEQGIAPGIPALSR
ncbi:hypothetical protein [Streptomyces sp. B1I3]|uniref:hypothetical protein n=1 Tax=Streptomyces sp. B1I3 TaxID=3042264 RepID=UPI00278907B0|nr:hypothetical protein [Streptomyces sp. B1I3]MDQ0793428.1 CBS domain-containing protein [Streptomyces sp. B1I3]